MKNIYLIPTTKEQHSIVRKHTGLLLIQTPRKEYSGTKLNIYITSDEEIKEGVDQWYLDKVLNEPYNSGGAQYSSNQDVIILTTDLDLIKDGIQAIDDEFLEWFVKNPSCEMVEVEDTCLEVRVCDCAMNENCLKPGYTIIIPQEEPKQEPCDNCNNDICCCTIRTQETLVKYAENHYDIIAEKSNVYGRDEYIAYSQGVQDGVKWQQERMYSEEDMQEYAEYCTSHVLKSQVGHPYLSATKWFEQFKKK